MRQFLPLLFGFVIFLSFLGYTEMIEFCDAFEGNGYTISYGFRRIDPKYSVNHIFIGEDYWKLDFADNKNVSEMTLGLKANNSKRPYRWIGSNYSMAFCVKTTFPKAPEFANNNCTTYLLHKSQKYWEYGFLYDPAMQIQMSEPKIRINVTNSSVLENGTIGFVPTYNERDSGFIILFNQIASHYDVYKPQSKEEDPIKYKFEGEKSKYQSLQNLSQNGEIVAIFGQYRDNKLLFGHGLIILFKVEKSLKYCWTHITTLSETCNPENQSILINCSKPVSTPLTTPMITTEGTDSELDTIIVILLIALGFIIILIIIFIVLIVYKTLKAKTGAVSEVDSFKTFPLDPKSKASHQISDRKRTKDTEK